MSVIASNLSYFDNIRFQVGDNELRYYNEDKRMEREYEGEEVPEDILSLKIREDESEEQRIAVAYYKDKEDGEVYPFLFVKFYGTTIGDWIDSLNEGVLESIIDPSPEIKEKIIDNINECVMPYHRYMGEEYLKKLENNDLTYFDIMGTHNFFEGGLELENGIWKFACGS